jgi:hypothetical protein
MPDDLEFELTPVDFDPWDQRDQAQQAREAAATRLRLGIMGQQQPQPRD